MMYLLAVALLITSGNAFTGKTVPRMMRSTSVLSMATTTVPTEVALAAVSNFIIPNLNTLMFILNTINLGCKRF